MYDVWTVVRRLSIAASLSITLAGCGSGGDDASTSGIITDPNTSPTSTDAAASSTWDQMGWDNGTWGN